MGTDTALAIAFLNGNLTDVAQAARRDGALAVGIVLELIRLGHGREVERFKTSLDAVSKEPKAVSKPRLRKEPKQTP